MIGRFLRALFGSGEEWIHITQLVERGATFESIRKEQGGMRLTLHCDSPELAGDVVEFSFLPHGVGIRVRNDRSYHIVAITDRAKMERLHQEIARWLAGDSWRFEDAEL